MSMDYVAIPKKEDRYLEKVDRRSSDRDSEDLVYIDQERVATRIVSEIVGMSRLTGSFPKTAGDADLEAKDTKGRWVSVDLDWKSGAIQVHVYTTHVVVHFSGSDSVYVKTLVQVLQILSSEGLFIWDSVGGEFIDPDALQHFD